MQHDKTFTFYGTMPNKQICFTIVKFLGILIKLEMMGISCKHRAGSRYWPSIIVYLGGHNLLKYKEQMGS